MHEPKLGKLMLVPNGTGDGSDSYYFEMAGEVFLPLKFEDGVDIHSIPLNSEISLSMSTEPINGFYVVTDGT